MKLKVQTTTLTITLSLLFSNAAAAFQNTVCENENSPFYLEIGFDKAFVLLKENDKLEKVLNKVSKKQKGKTIFKNADWSLTLSRDKGSARLELGDSDEIVRFDCSVE